LNAIQAAQAQSVSRDVAIIAKAATEDWRAAAWRLEHPRPDYYDQVRSLRHPRHLEEELEALNQREERLRRQFKGD
jgi:hypothetical protein